MERKVKVLHVAPLDRTLYHFRFHLIRAQLKAGFEVHLAFKTTRDDFVNEMVKSGVRVHPMDMERSISLTNLRSNINRVTRILRQHNIDIMHSHTPIGGVIGRISASRANTPHVFHTTGGWYFHEHMSPPKHLLFRSVEKYLASKTDIVFSVNQEDIASAEQYGIRAKRDIVYSGPAGVNIDRFNPEKYDREKIRRDLEIAPDEFILTLIARFVWEKGFREMFDMLSILQRSSKFKILIVGAGPKEKEIKDYGSEKGLDDHIRYLGYRTDIPEILAATDVYVFTSHREGVPVSVQEAMAMQVPPVAFSIRGCRELVEDGKSGKLIPFGDTDGMAQAVQQVLNDSTLASALGKGGRERILEGYTTAHHVERQMPFYLEILERSLE